MAQQRGRKRTTRRARKSVSSGQAHIHATFNNTIITFCDPHTGEVLCWDSAGSAGYKGSRKSTPYAAQLAGETAARAAQDHGMREVDVFVKGPGPGRDAAIRSIQQGGLTVKSITDVTPIPHNGCRPPKKRRV